MAVDDILEIRTYSRHMEQIGINVLHYLVVSEVTGGATQDEIAIAEGTRYATVYRAAMSNTATYYGLTVQKIYPAPIPVASLSRGGTGVGSAGVNILPMQVSGLLTWRTALAGRHGHGRSYIPFPSTAAVDSNGLLQPGYLVELIALANVYVGGDTVVGGTGNSIITPIIWNRKLKVPTKVTGFQANGSGMATQRRRGTYGRPNPLPV